MADVDDDFALPTELESEDDFALPPELAEPDAPEDPPDVDGSTGDDDFAYDTTQADSRDWLDQARDFAMGAAKSASFNLIDEVADPLYKGARDAGGWIDEQLFGRNRDLPEAAYIDGMAPHFVDGNDYGQLPSQLADEAMETVAGKLGYVGAAVVGGGAAGAKAGPGWLAQAKLGAAQSGLSELGESHDLGEAAKATGTGFAAGGILSRLLGGSRATARAPEPIEPIEQVADDVWTGAGPIDETAAENLGWLRAREQAGHLPDPTPPMSQVRLEQYDPDGDILTQFLRWQRGRMDDGLPPGDPGNPTDMAEIREVIAAKIADDAAAREVAETGTLAGKARPRRHSPAAPPAEAVDAARPITMPRAASPNPLAAPAAPFVRRAADQLDDVKAAQAGAGPNIAAAAPVEDAARQQMNANLEWYLANNPAPVVRQPLAPLLGRAAASTANAAPWSAARDWSKVVMAAGSSIPQHLRGASEHITGAVTRVASSATEPAVQPWAMQAVNASGDTGISRQQDQERFDAALMRGDDSELAALNFQFAFKYPEFAKKMRAMLESVQDGAEFAF